MQLIENINLYNKNSSKINFKSKDNNNFDILNQKIINNEIFETIMVSSAVGIASEYILKDMKNREKAFKYGINMVRNGNLGNIVFDFRHKHIYEL